MPAPVYINDLITIATGDLNFDLGVWDESADAGWDTAGAMVDDENLQYVKTSINSGEAADSCTSAQYTKIGTGSGSAGPGTIMYAHTAAFTVPTDGVVLIDNLWAAPLALNPYAGSFGVAEAGVSVLIGNDVSNFDVHYVSGSDKPPAPEGGWTTYCVDPTVAPDGTIGTVTNTKTVGVGIAAVAQARGNPHACQSVRYGRAEVTYTVGDAATPATFSGYATIDNANADRFNLLKIIKGGYEARGLMTFGTAATAVHFDDSDKSIVIADDPKVSSAFNKGIVNNAASVVNWSNISITNISSVSKYSFAVNDSATTNQDGCVFTDIGVFTYGSNSTQTNTTYRRQELITQGGSAFVGCLFDEPLGTGLLADDLNPVSDCTFASQGTGHAIEIDTAGTYNLTAHTFTDYAAVDGSTGDEAIYNNSGGLVTLNASGITGVISIRNGIGATTVVNNNTQMTFSGMKDESEVRVYKVSDGSEVAGIEIATSGSVDDRTFVWSAAAGLAVDYVIHNWDGIEPFYQTLRKNNYTIPSVDTTIEIAQLIDRNAA